MHDDVDARDAAWAEVRSRKELSGEAKLAWHLLWKRGGRRPGEVWFSFVELLLDQGRTDARSARRWVRELRSKRFVEWLEGGDGRGRVFVKQPQDVLRPVEREGFTEEQRELFTQHRAAGAEESFASHGSAEAWAADSAPHPPADSAPEPPPPPLTLSTRAQPTFTLTLNSSSKYESKALTSGTIGAADVAREPPPSAAAEPAPIGAAMAAIAAAVSRRPGDELERVEVLTDRILARVGDRRLQRRPAELVARALVEGVLPASEFEGVMSWLEESCRRVPLNKGKRWVLFVGGFGRAFARLGLPWPFGSKKPR